MTKVVSSRLSDKTGMKKAPISRDLRNTGKQTTQPQGISSAAALKNKKRDAQREPLKRRNCKPRPKSNASKGGNSRSFVPHCK